MRCSILLFTACLVLLDRSQISVYDDRVPAFSIPLCKIILLNRFFVLQIVLHVVFNFLFLQIATWWRNIRYAAFVSYGWRNAWHWQLSNSRLHHCHAKEILCKSILGRLHSVSLHSMYLLAGGIFNIENMVIVYCFAEPIIEETFRWYYETATAFWLCLKYDEKFNASSAAGKIYPNCALNFQYNSQVANFIVVH